MSHEAHAASIAEAHRKETDAMKAYLHYLEASYDSRHPNMHISIPSNDLRGPSPDIKVPGDTGKKPASSDSDASTSQPQDSNDKDDATRERNGSEASISSSEGQEKVKKLKQKLDLATQHLVAMKDQMEMLMSRKDAYKDRVADLEVRVRNNHELLIDLRESEYKLEMERRLMHERHRQLNGELEALRTRPEQSQISKLETDLAEEKQRAGLLTAQLEAAQMRTPVPDVVGELTRKIDDMQQRLKEKDEQVYELRHVNQALQLDLEELDTQQAKYAAEHDEELAQEARKRREVKNRARLAESENTELREVVEAQGHDLVTVQEEYERLRKLLHSEMRSQAKESISRNLIPESTQQPSTDPYERIDLLEKEIQHHVNELIRCKRDNRSYRKDIKRANTKIDKMRNSVYSAGNNSDSNLYRQASLQRPITPTESPIKQKPSMAGLEHLSNFNFPPPCDPPAYPPPKDPPSRPKTPKTPKTPRTPYKLTPTITRTPSLGSIKPTPSSPANRPSAHRFHTTTCFGSDTHPSSPAAPAVVAAPAPPPAPHHRAGTQRSLSESILSSYADTTPPAADKAVVDQARPVLVAHAPGPPEVVDNTVGLTALPPVVRPGSGSAARGQEERLGLVRKRSDSVLRRKESQDGFLRRVASGRSLGVEGVISRFNSRGRVGAGVVVPVMLESEDEK
ncbi:hypothetical protein UCRNP2_259 [Neofusicoccum parvum UCRNP2]|uniref:Uncharacterized protein n=1 Tax=Botryosphaeria parva (strain UCR-NP2) TaxID=1287680 RepID=R1GMM5_BOTPV|nr:hypothetical protein UCRNP2_259 [Neofusicoccum parvum UCRNP2]